MNSKAEPKQFSNETSEISYAAPANNKRGAGVNSVIEGENIHEPGTRFQLMDSNQTLWAGKPAPKERARATAVLVDDCGAIRGALTDMLTALGYKVTSASSGRQALATTSEAETVLSLAVLDMQMPGLTGTQTLSRLRERHPELPAVLMSGRNECYFRSQLEPLTTYVFLQKPFNLPQLARAVVSAQAGDRTHQ